MENPNNLLISRMFNHVRRIYCCALNPSWCSRRPVGEKGKGLEINETSVLSWFPASLPQAMRREI